MELLLPPFSFRELLKGKALGVHGKAVGCLGCKPKWGNSRIPSKGGWGDKSVSTSKTLILLPGTCCLLGRRAVFFSRYTSHRQLHGFSLRDTSFQNRTYKGFGKRAFSARSWPECERHIPRLLEGWQLRERRGVSDHPWPRGCQDSPSAHVTMETVVLKIPVKCHIGSMRLWRWPGSREFEEGEGWQVSSVSSVPGTGGSLAQLWVCGSGPA